MIFITNPVVITYHVDFYYKSGWYYNCCCLLQIRVSEKRATVNAQFSSHYIKWLVCPFSFFTPFSTENVPVSYTFHLQMVPFPHTLKRALDHFLTSVTDQIATTGSRGLKCTKCRGTQRRFPPKYILRGAIKVLPVWSF